MSTFGMFFDGKPEGHQALSFHCDLPLVEATHPGAWLALSGFDIQLTLALSRSVRLTPCHPPWVPWARTYRSVRLSLELGDPGFWAVSAKWMATLPEVNSTGRCPSATLPV